ITGHSVFGLISSAWMRAMSVMASSAEQQKRGRPLMSGDHPPSAPLAFALFRPARTMSRGQKPLSTPLIVRIGPSAAAWTLRRLHLRGVESATAVKPLVDPDPARQARLRLRHRDHRATVCNLHPGAGDGVTRVEKIVGSDTENSPIGELRDTDHGAAVFDLGPGTVQVRARAEQVVG